MIEQTSANLETTRKNRKETKADRVADNKEYRQEVKHLTASLTLLEGAISVLKKYYQKMLVDGKAGSSFIQTSTKQEPDTWNEDYSGQSQGGNSAINMLEFIISQSKRDMKIAHENEAQAQADFEDAMNGFKQSEDDDMRMLAELQQELSESQEELSSLQEEKKKTEDELADIYAYKEQIKPGCDFIVLNIADRDTKREQEHDGLVKAAKLMKASPAYVNYKKAAHQETLGDCRDLCQGEDEQKLLCKACLDGVSVSAFCSEHEDTQGCGTDEEEAASRALYLHKEKMAKGEE